MRIFSAILLPALLLLAPGCTTRLPPQTPLSANELKGFLDRAKDPRILGITQYQTAYGPHYDMANRVHMERYSDVHFRYGRRTTPLPFFMAESRSRDPVLMLLDTSARDSWGRFESSSQLTFTLFKPPSGEYPDHVEADIPGYVGCASRLRAGNFVWEQPILYMPPARGGLGPLLRQEQTPDDKRLHPEAIMGYSILRQVNYLRLDYSNALFRVSARAKPYQAAAGFTTLLDMPLRDWRGRPAVMGSLDGAPPEPCVIDSAGDFDLSLPGDPNQHVLPAILRLGELELPLYRVHFHRELGLPEDFPPRIGIGILSRQITILAIQQKRFLLEIPQTGADPDAEDDAGNAPALHYEGIRPRTP